MWSSPSIEVCDPIRSVPFLRSLFVCVSFSLIACFRKRAFCLSACQLEISNRTLRRPFQPLRTQKRPFAKAKKSRKDSSFPAILCNDRFVVILKSFQFPTKLSKNNKSFQFPTKTFEKKGLFVLKLYIITSPCNRSLTS